MTVVVAGGWRRASVGDDGWSWAFLSTNHDGLEGHFWTCVILHHRIAKFGYLDVTSQHLY